jgi:hypothetical protein
MSVPFTKDQVSDIMNNNIDKTPSVILVDFDDTLFHTTTSLLLAIIKDHRLLITKFELLDSIITHLKEDDMLGLQRLLYNRKDYYLGKWLGMCDKVVVECLIKNAGLIYTQLDQYPLAQGLIDLSRGEGNTIKVITHQPPEICLTLKQDLLTRVFGEHNWEFHAVPFGMTKGEYVNANKVHFDTFIDDRLDIVVEMAKSVNPKSKLFLVSDHGYNDAGETKSAVNSIVGRGGNLLVCSSTELKL